MSAEIIALRERLRANVTVLWRARRIGNKLKVERQLRRIRELKKTLAHFEEAEADRHASRTG